MRMWMTVTLPALKELKVKKKKREREKQKGHGQRYYSLSTYCVSGTFLSS
jgi:hypothetical protein